MPRLLKALPLAFMLSCGGQKHVEKGLEFRNWFVVKPVAGATGSVAYGQIKNTSAERMTLAKADFNCAGSTELHETVTADGRARMVPLGEIGLDPGGSVIFEPGHKHIMLMRLKETGENCAAVFTFSQTTVQFNVPVKAREK